MELVMLKDSLARLKHGRLVHLKQFDRVDDWVENRFFRGRDRMKFEIQQVVSGFASSDDARFPVVYVKLMPSERQRFLGALRAADDTKPVALVVNGRVLYVGSIDESLRWEIIYFRAPSKEVADSFVVTPK